MNTKTVLMLVAAYFAYQWWQKQQAQAAVHTQPAPVASPPAKGLKLPRGIHTRIVQPTPLPQVPSVDTEASFW